MSTTDTVVSIVTKPLYDAQGSGTIPSGYIIVKQLNVNPPQQMSKRIEVRITRKQKEIINKIKDGYIIMIGYSEFDHRPYYMITKDFDYIYFRSDFFGRLLSSGLIEQKKSYPFNYELTTLAITKTA